MAARQATKCDNAKCKLAHSKYLTGLVRCFEAAQAKKVSQQLLSSVFPCPDLCFQMDPIQVLSPFAALCLTRIISLKELPNQARHGNCSKHAWATRPRPDL